MLMAVLNKVTHNHSLRRAGNVVQYNSCELVFEYTILVRISHWVTSATASSADKNPGWNSVFYFMAQRRMFSKNVARTDAFLDMSQTAQNLYFHLGIDADDDGFVSPKMVMRITGSNGDDLKILVAKGFLIPFEDGVVVVRHWRINNEIRQDRYKATQYVAHKSKLAINEGIYDMVLPTVLPIGDTGKVRLGKVKDSGGRFTPPTLEEVKNYCIERNNNVDHSKWHDFYTAKGWMVGKNKMKDWQAAVRTWEKDTKVDQPDPRKVQEKKEYEEKFYQENGFYPLR